MDTCFICQKRRAFITSEGGAWVASFSKLYTRLMSKKIFLANVELEVLPTSETYNGEGRMICFVNCFCYTTNKQDAIGHIKLDLKAQDINLIRVNSICEYEYREEIWGIEELEEYPDDYAREATQTEQVVYSIFSCYQG